MCFCFNGSDMAPDRRGASEANADLLSPLRFNEAVCFSIKL